MKAAIEQRNGTKHLGAQLKAQLTPQRFLSSCTCPRGACTQGCNQTAQSNRVAMTGAIQQKGSC
eukprot:12333379-Alexandrium_andersonii.AAC.1